MIYSYGGRVDNDSNAVTVIDEQNRTAETTGYVNGEYVEFSGGGSSDFSTAEVTIVNNTAGSFDTAYMPYAMDADAEQGSPDISMPTFLGGIPVGTSSYNAILYKGSCYLEYMASASVEITGSAEKLFDGAIVITGDCTITIGSH